MKIRIGIRIGRRRRRINTNNNIKKEKKKRIKYIQSQYKHNTLGEEHVKKLNDMGFQWEHKAWAEDRQKKVYQYMGQKIRFRSMEQMSTSMIQMTQGIQLGIYMLIRKSIKS